MKELPIKWQFRGWFDFSTKFENCGSMPKLGVVASAFIHKDAYLSVDTLSIVLSHFMHCSFLKQQVYTGLVIYFSFR
jgi:hypothetical protein